MTMNIRLPDKYERHRGTKLWRTVDRTIRALERNNDLILQTHRWYVVGALCQAINPKKEPKKR